MTTEEQLKQAQDQLTGAQKTIESLTAKNKAQDTELATRQKAIDTLTKQLADSKAAHEEDVTAAAGVIGELKTRLEASEKQTAKLPTLTYGKETYELHGGSFMYKGEEITIERLKEDGKLVKALLEDGFGSLRKLEK